jgi:hypothetical protein
MKMKFTGSLSSSSELVNSIQNNSFIISLQKDLTQEFNFTILNRDTTKNEI